MSPDLDRALEMLRHVQGRVRLRVLVALEGRERSSRQLMAELDEDFDPINNALRALRRDGFVVLVREEKTGRKRNTTRRIYTARRSGWLRFAQAIDGFAAELLPSPDEIPTPEELEALDVELEDEPDED